jgi:putative NADPH-quinone reductase
MVEHARAMARRILIIQGHPDPAGGHFCHALAEAYAAGAAAAGHAVERIAVAALDFPLLRTKADYDGGTPPPDIQRAQAAIQAAEHLVILYPMWGGDMPALLKGFLEQVLRPSFAFDTGKRGIPGGRLRGRSARIVVTLGMPALAYQLYFCAHGLKNLKRNILGLCGIAPIHASLIGGIETLGERRRAAWLARLEALGQAAA